MAELDAKLVASRAREAVALAGAAAREGGQAQAVLLDLYEEARKRHWKVHFTSTKWEASSPGPCRLGRLKQGFGGILWHAHAGFPNPAEA